MRELEQAKAIASRTRRELKELRCLTDFMDQDMRDIFDIKQQISTRNITDISFEHLWQLHKPGDVVFRPFQHESSHYQA